MRRTGRVRVWLAAGALAAVLAQGAAAQRLNLGGAEPPVTATPHFLSVVGGAEGSIEAARRRESDHSRDEAERARAALGGALARAALRAMEAARDAGGESAELAWLGVRLSEDSAQIVADAAVAGAHPQALRFAAGALDRAGPGPAGEAGRARAMLRGVRDALAPLAGEAAADAGQPAWFHTPGAIAREAPGTARQLAEQLQLDEAALAAASALDARLEAASGLAAYVHAAAQVRAALAEVSLCLKSPPGWLSASARSAMAELAAEALADAEGREGAAPDYGALERCAAMCGAVLALDRLKPVAGPGDAAGPLRESMSRYVPVAAGAAERGVTERMRWLARAVLACAGEEGPDVGAMRASPAMVQQLRPALQVLEKPLREANRQLLLACGRLLSVDGSLTDPAVLGAWSAQRAAAQDVARLWRINTVFAPEEARPGRGDAPAQAAEAWRGPAAAVLRLAQAAGRPGQTGETAQQELRGFLRTAEEVLVIPGEETLRANPESELAAELLGTLDAARAEWSKSLLRGRGDEPAEHVAAARGVRAVVLLARACGASPFPRWSDGVWPGLRLPAIDGDALRRAAEARLRDARAAVARKDASRPAALLAESAAGDEVVWFAQAAARAAMDAGGPGRAPRATLGVWAQGPPGRDAWLAGEAETLAKLNLWLAQWSFSERRDEAALRNARAHAAKLLDVLGER